MKQLIQRSDCNKCDQRNCPPHVFGRMQYDCKSYRPIKSGLGSVFENAFLRNPQAAADCLTKCNIRVPQEVK